MENNLWLGKRFARNVTIGDPFDSLVMQYYCENGGKSSSNTEKKPEPHDSTMYLLKFPETDKQFHKEYSWEGHTEVGVTSLKPFPHREHTPVFCALSRWGDKLFPMAQLFEESDPLMPILHKNENTGLVARLITYSQGGRGKKTYRTKHIIFGVSVKVFVLLFRKVFKSVHKTWIASASKENYRLCSLPHPPFPTIAFLSSKMAARPTHVVVTGVPGKSIQFRLELNFQQIRFWMKLGYVKQICKNPQKVPNPSRSGLLMPRRRDSRSPVQLDRKCRIFRQNFLQGNVASLWVFPAIPGAKPSHLPTGNGDIPSCLSSSAAYIEIMSGNHFSFNFSVHPLASDMNVLWYF